MKLFYFTFLLLLLSLISKAQNFATIDAHAKATPTNAEKNIASLAQYLNEGSTNETEKVRAYYIWLSSNIAYDTKTFFSNNPKPKTSAEDALKRKRAICQGYAELFKALCNESNIECFIVAGYSKGYGYSPNKKFDNSDHAWNSVKVDGTWKILDATWGAGYVDNNKRYVAKFSDEYFLSDPKDFIIKHMPVDPMWQLLPCPISLDDFKLADAEIIKLTASSETCFSFVDTIIQYTQLSDIEQQVASAERALRFNPKNYAVAGYAYLNLGFELSQGLKALYDAQNYTEALALNKEVLQYNEKAYSYLRKSNSPQTKNAADICKNNIDTMKENIKSLEGFMK